MARDREATHGTGETLRGALVIVVAGVMLGAGYNALGLASHPPRGLSWVKRVPALPRLEDLQGGGPVAVPAAPGPVRPSAAGGAIPDPAASRPSRAPAGPAPTPSPPRTEAIGSSGAPGTTPSAPAGDAPSPSGPAADLPAVPDRDEPIEIGLATAKRFFDAGGALIVDAREAPEFAAGRIPGALNLPFDDVVAKPALLEPVKRAGRPILVYCDGASCELSRSLAYNMLAEGIRKVLVYTGGFDEWRAAGYPVERGPESGGSR